MKRKKPSVAGFLPLSAHRRIEAWHLSAKTWLARYGRVSVLVGLALVAYVGAINRGQPLPWVIASLLSASLILGVALPHWLLMRLSVRRAGPQRAAEGDTVVFQIEVENSGWLPRFMVELVDRLPFCGAAAGQATSADKTLGVLAYLPRRHKKRYAVPVVCEKRGYYRIGPVGLASAFPLGLIEVRRRNQNSMQALTVYPAVFPITTLPLHGAPSQVHRGGYLLPQGAGAAEFSGLREYRAGDNPRHVHWPTTARLNELMVKEFEPLASACLCLCLDQARDANVGAGRHASFEYAVRIAASIAAYAACNGIPTRLQGQGAQTLEIGAGSGEIHYRGLLDRLAVIDADGVTPYARVLERTALDCQRGETVVAFLSEPETRHADTLQALALQRLRGVNLFAVVIERDSFSPYAPAAAIPLTPSRQHAALCELGAHCVTVRRGDDLLKVFNP